MADEPWDELMGPGPTTSSSSSNAPARDDPPPVRTSSGAPPPAAMFASLPSAPAVVTPPPPAVPPSPPPPSSGAATKAKSSLAFEDEDDDDQGDPYNTSRLAQDGASIRQEALKMLQAADTVHEDSQYSVHRTVSGGFMATAKGLDDSSSSASKHRVPRALAGVSFTSNRHNVGRRYRDDPVGASSWQDDVDSVRLNRSSADSEGYKDDVVDVVGMERRSSSARPVDAESTRSNSNWSSRYAIDHNTMMAMSGGTLSSDNRSILNELKQSQRDRQAARNLSTSRQNSVFGSASSFSFRQNHIFGQQQATVQQQPNLQTVWIDGASLPAAEPRKSWQEQLQAKRRQRRRYLYAAVLLVVVLVTLGSVLGQTTNVFAGLTRSSASASLTFFVTSNVPYNHDEEAQLATDLASLSTKQEQFLVHLGNLQDAATTLCASSHYENVASQLLASPLPTFVLPGEQDWMQCPRPNTAWDRWTEQFQFFDGHFSKPFSVERDGTVNFCFEDQGVLLLGLHVVAGTSTDTDEIEWRNDANIQWMERKIKDYQETARAIVVFANARPGHPSNEDFFDDAVQLWSEAGKPVAYVHASGGGGILSAGESQPWPEAPNVVAIQVPKGGRDQPPLRMNVGFGDQPFVVG